MRSLLTGRLRVFEQSPAGLLHVAQPPLTIGVKAAELGQDAQPLIEPGAFFVDGSYALRINSWNSLAGAAVTVRMRFLGSDGRIRDNEFVHTPNSNRTKATNDFALSVGFPLNITAFASTGAPLVGQTFVQVQLISGLGGATTLLGTLLQDYVTAAQALAWPGSPIRSSIDGGGFPRFILGTGPAAGAEISESVPTGARWELLALFAGFTAAAGGGARQPALQALSGASGFAVSLQSGTTAAATAQNYSWVSGLGDNLAVAAFRAHASWGVGLLLMGGESIKTATANLQAGDQWNAPQYRVREFLEAAS